MFLKWFLSYLGMSPGRDVMRDMGGALMAVLVLGSLAAWGALSTTGVVQGLAFAFALACALSLTAGLLVGPVVGYVIPNLQRCRHARTEGHDLLVSRVLKFNKALARGKNPRAQAQELLEAVVIYWALDPGWCFQVVDVFFMCCPGRTGKLPALEVDNPLNPRDIWLRWEFQGKEEDKHYQFV